MAVRINIRNLKNIASLDYMIPDNSGVYVITGLNGCWKTSLLVAINRITYPNAFRDYYLQARGDVDTYSGAKISYEAEDCETGEIWTVPAEVDDRVANAIDWLYDTSYPNEGITIRTMKIVSRM